MNKTLLIITDLNEHAWLQYILEEFERTNGYVGEIKTAVQGSRLDTQDKYFIYYTTSPARRPSIINRSNIITSEIIYLPGNKFVLAGTQTHDPRFVIGFDLFWNAFVFLSRLEEVSAAFNGKQIKSYASRHPRSDKGTFEIPIVNILFNQLEDLIKEYYPELDFENKQNNLIELSHDVDYIQKTPQLRIKQSIFNFYNLLRSSSCNDFRSNLIKSFQFLSSRVDYWCFDYWEELEKRFARRSIFYIYAKAQKRTPKTWLLDPSYDLKTNKRLIHKLKHLLSEGFDIGLHGSFKSATDGALLKWEKEILERTLGINCKRIRQHWLRYDESITPYLHNEFFQFDSTMGWNDRIGFRSGILSLYRPFDHKNNKPFDYYIVPQVIMDSHIFDYGSYRREAAIQSVFLLLKQLTNYKNVHISISWHQRVCSKDYNWHHLYENILNVI